MAGVTWERTRTPGVYRRDGARGRHYRHSYRDAGRRQVNCSRETTLAGAEAHQREMLNNRPHDVTAGRITLQDAYDVLHADPRAEYAGATVTLHADLWNALRRAAPSLPGRQLKDIDPRTLRAALDKIAAPTMRDKTRQLVGLIYRHADARPNPAVKEYTPRTRAARMAEAKENGRYLDAGAVERLTAEMPERYRFLIRLLWRVGLRPGEAFALTVGQFDPDAQEVTVDRAVNDGVVGPTKTGRTRTPPLPSLIADEMADYIRMYADFTEPDRVIFTTETGEMIDADNFRRRIFGPAATRAGLAGIRVYDLRHSFCSDAVAAGVDLATIAEMAGHSVQVLASTYVHYSAENGRRAAKVLDAVLREGVTNITIP